MRNQKLGCPFTRKFVSIWVKFSFVGCCCCCCCCCFFLFFFCWFVFLGGGVGAWGVGWGGGGRVVAVA